MAPDPITNEDILDRFLITLMYGDNIGDWPHVTIAACKIIFTDEDGNELPVLHQVYRNEVDKHAEVKLIEYLRWDPAALQAREIKIEVYINYSPCSECADTILDYIKAMKLLKREITMTIVFANFYKIYPNNLNTHPNVLGLISLYNQPGVELRLLGVHVGWETFLDMGEFFNPEEDKNECLDKADSPQRNTRKEQDQNFWNDIFGVEEIASGVGEL